MFKTDSQCNVQITCTVTLIPDTTFKFTYVSTVSSEPPTPPSDISIDSVKSRSVKLSWRDMTRSLAQYYSVQITATQRLVWSTARTINVTK